MSEFHKNDPFNPNTAREVYLLLLSNNKATKIDKDKN